MQVETRVLNLGDFDPMHDLVLNSNVILGCPMPSDYIGIFLDRMRMYLDPADESGKAVGVFYGEQMICFLTMYFWKTLPYWTFANLKSRRDVGHEYRGISRAMTLMFEIADAMHLNTYYVVANAERRLAYDKYYARYVPAIHAYQNFFEAVVPKGTRPASDVYWSWMGKKEWPVDLAIGGGKKIIT